MYARRIRVTRIVFNWCVLVICAAGLVAGAEPQPRSIIRGPARFQALAPNLVRMEYSPAQQFVDAPSVAVVKRDWAAVPYQVREVGGWLEIETGKMAVRYRLGSQAFQAENLQVRWKDEQGEHVWKPGDKDDKNLGGVRSPDIALRVEPGDEPGALSRNGYFFLDDSHTAVWDESRKWVKPRPEKDSFDWYFFVYGRDYKLMLRQLAELLGRVPMVPRYVLGTWVGSRAGYSAEEWKMLANRFREESVPADLLVLDSDSFCKVTWSGYDIDYEQMPEPKEFFAELLKRGFRVTVNEHYDALTRENDHNFEAIRQLLQLPPNTQEIPHDLANHKYAEAFMELLHKPRLDMGMAFWWQDGWAGAKMPGLDPALWTRQIEYEGSERITGKRTFAFCRLGAWGSHRYGGYFTGDLIPYWATLKLLIPYDVQGGNMLVDYVINLCAGVFQETVDPELYTRWVQFSALSPVFWWHGLWGLRYPWEYGPKSFEITRHFLRLRYRLLPYMYTYTRLAHDTALPLVRGVYLEYPDQEPAYTYRHQYLFGQELLVAPVSEPGNGKPVLTDVYLPAGDNWFDFFMGRIYGGGQAVSYECPLERAPLFVRAGSIVPMGPETDYTDQQPLDPLTVDVYAGKAAAFRLYEDDGDSLDYRQGAYAWTPLTYSPEAGGTHRIEIGPSTGRYSGQLQSRSYLVRVHGLLKPETILVNGRTLPGKQPGRCGEGCEGWSWDKEARVTTIRLTEPTPVSGKLTLVLENAGTFADAEMLQKVLDYRARVRRVKQQEKLKWAMLLGGKDVKKPPRVIRQTDQVETELNELVSNPRGRAERAPNFLTITARLLKAFVDQPFESTRATPLPLSEREPREAAEILARASFLPEEVRSMTAELLGLDLVGRAFGTPSPLIQTRLLYDTEAIGPAKVSYELTLPQEGLPGWAAVGPPAVVGAGYTQFNVRAPFLAQRGNYQFKIKATLTWDGGSTEIQRDVDWFSLLGQEVPLEHGMSFPNLLKTYGKGVLPSPKD